MTHAEGMTDIRAGVRGFFARPIFSDYRTLAILWGVLAIVAALTKGWEHGQLNNNFLIYRQVFLHLTEMKPLYAYYPGEYFDHNLYGPLFSMVIAPFAVLPKFAGIVCWMLAMCAVLYAAILKMPLAKGAKIFILWYVSNEVLGALFMCQFNIVITALVVTAYTAVRKNRPGLAAFCIMLGTMTKLYGIAGLAFLPFARRKWRLAGWMAVWGALFFVLPMAFSSPGYVVGQYGEWFATLMDKNALNNEAFYQNISLIGMTHRVSGAEFSDVWILVPGALLFLLPGLRRGQYRYAGFQWGVVASVLMCIILFSTGSESSGYIIALTGVAIWYVTAPWKRSTADVVLLIFVLVLSSFGHSDLVPKAIRNGIIKPYALKALPVTIVWLKLIWEMCTRDYRPRVNREESLAEVDPLDP